VGRATGALEAVLSAGAAGGAGIAAGGRSWARAREAVTAGNNTPVKAKLAPDKTASADTTRKRVVIENISMLGEGQSVASGVTRAGKVGNT
jgi:hypothetical protein